MPDPAPNQPVQLWPWLRERLFPRGTNLIQWASYVILVTTLILQVLNPPAVSPFAYNSSLTALAILLAINFVWDDLRKLFPSERSGDWALVLTSMALAFYTILIGQMFGAIYVLFMVAAQANAMLPSLPAIALTILMSGAYLGLLAQSGASPGSVQGTAIGLLIGMTFTATLSQVLLRYSEQSERANRLLEQLQQANADLLAARQKEKELVIAEERVRMARDLHDGLGHHLTALSIQLQAAEKLVRANPDLAAEAVRNARAEVQAALKEVRQSVAVLREAPVDIQDLAQSIGALVGEMGRLTGMQASFTQTGQPARLTPAAAMTLFRAAQEGLTNVQKHAREASRVQVHLAYAPGEVSLVVEDNGKAAAPAQDSAGGFGLAGLRERANLLGGRFTCGSLPEGGFQILVALPVAGPPEGGSA